MIRRVGVHVRNQWAGFLALFLVLAGGTAVAATGALDGPAPGQNSVGSLDIINGQVQSSDIQDNAIGSGKVQNASLSGTDIANDTLTSDDVAPQSIKGADIRPQSGVDSCVASIRLGSLCVRAENSIRSRAEALIHCANLNLRVPTIGEALQLARNYDIPDADPNEAFWTDEETVFPNYEGTAYTPGGYVAFDDNNGGHYGRVYDAYRAETVCVMTPVN